jgi:hypothetical protein
MQFMAGLFGVDLPPKPRRLSMPRLKEKPKPRKVRCDNFKPVRDRVMVGQMLTVLNSLPDTKRPKIQPVDEGWWWAVMRDTADMSKEA